MAKVKFYLVNPDPESDKKTPIFFRFSYGAYKIVNGKKQYLNIRYFISESIEPKFWNIKAGRVRPVRGFPQYPEFNARLDTIENTAYNVLRRLQNNGIEPTNDILKREFDIIWNAGKNKTIEPTAGMELMQYISHFINTTNVRESTKKSYRIVERNLIEYQTEKRKKLVFASIDIDFYNDFIKYMKSKNYAPNTIGTRIKILKTFLYNAKEAGLDVTSDFEKKAFTKPKEETESVYLNESELSNIFNLNLSKSQKLDRTRDLFLIGCYTGLRFSDLKQLSKNDIKDNIISVKTIKTGTSVAIPLHPVVVSILNKYEYDLPKVPSNQKFNEYLKDIARLAGIDVPVIVEQTKGDIKVKSTVLKYNLVSSHTARRSFATNAYLNDIPSISIMKITGHKTESSFMKYIKISQEENAKKLKSHKFFSPIRIAE